MANRSLRDKIRHKGLRSSNKPRPQMIPTQHQRSTRQNNRLSLFLSPFSSSENRSTRSSSREGDIRTTMRSPSAKVARSLPVVTQRTLSLTLHLRSRRLPPLVSTRLHRLTSITASRRIELIQSRCYIWPQSAMAALSLGHHSGTSVSQTKSVPLSPLRTRNSTQTSRERSSSR